MSEERREIMLDLLLKKAVEGLSAAEQGELDMLDTKMAADEVRSFEMTAAAINISGAQIDEPLPSHLYSKIIAESSEFVGAALPWPGAKPKTENEQPGPSWFGWLGWAAAAAACIALAFNIWVTRAPENNLATVKPTPEVPKILTPAQMREEMLRSTVELIKANWSVGNVKEMKIEGDIVWSDKKQAGYMRFRGLPVNDKAKETYQLWIFDKTQDPKTPIDGGTFDVSSDGEVVIPINAKLKSEGPALFAVTIEKPGGVVVSKREKIAALAKVENQTS